MVTGISHIDVGTALSKAEWEDSATHQWTDHLTPGVANIYTVGTAVAEVLSIYIGTGRAYFYTDQQEWIYSDGTALILGVNGANEVTLTSTLWAPSTDAGLQLGDATHGWYYLYNRGDYNAQLVTKPYSDPAIIIENTEAAATKYVSGGIRWKNNDTTYSNYEVQIVGAANSFYVFGTTDAWASAVFMMQITSTAWLPGSTANTIDLGSITGEFKDAYIGNVLYFYIDQSEYIYSDGTNLYFGVGGFNRWHISSGGDWFPASANTYDVGGTANEIANIYVAGIVYFFTDQAEYITSDGSGIQIYTDSTGQLLIANNIMRAWIDNDLDLGSTGFRYKDIHYAGAVIGPKQIEQIPSSMVWGGLNIKGIYVHVAGEGCWAAWHVPASFVSASKIVIWARADLTETHGMRASINVYAGADNEAYNTHTTSGTYVTTTQNFATDDIIYWEVDISATGITAGDHVQLQLQFIAADATDSATYCYVTEMIFQYTG